jgi:hypothetical protein
MEIKSLKKSWKQKVGVSIQRLKECLLKTVCPEKKILKNRTQKNKKLTLENTVK